MNIFVLDNSPVQSAKDMCDKHIVKMIVESGQMLSTCLHHYNAPNKDKVYRASYTHHPCTKWVIASKENYSWLLTHFVALCREYTRRYNKIHKTQALLPEFESFKHPNQRGLTEFAQAMPDEYKDINVVTAYRNYYMGEKKRFAKWKMGNQPKWWIDTKEKT